MISIQELLSRIRWDRNFAQGAAFEIGYSDHVQQRIVRLSFAEILFEADNKFSFLVRSKDGDLLRIPFHRIKEVYKDGILIWHRPG